MISDDDACVLCKYAIKNNRECVLCKNKSQTLVDTGVFAQYAKHNKQYTKEQRDKELKVKKDSLKEYKEKVKKIYIECNISIQSCWVFNICLYFIDSHKLSCINNMYKRNPKERYR